MYKMYKITPAGPLSSSQPSGTVCWASPLTFGLLEGEYLFPFLPYIGSQASFSFPSGRLFAWQLRLSLPLKAEYDLSDFIVLYLNILLWFNGVEFLHKKYLEKLIPFFTKAKGWELPEL